MISVSIAGDQHLNLEDVGGELLTEFAAIYSDLSVLDDTAHFAHFVSVVHVFLDSSPDDWEAHDAYFNNFSVIWQFLLSEGRLQGALFLWDKALEPIDSWELSHPDQHVHKGSAFYFSAGTALMAGNLDLAFLCLHRAIDEDRKRAGVDNPNTPAWRFAVLDDRNTNNLWLPYIRNAALFLEARLGRYSQECGRALNLTMLRAKFLERTALRDPILFFVYNLWRAERLLSSKGIFDSTFSPLILTSVLSNFYTLLETLLKHRYPTVHQLNNLITHMSMAMGMSLHRPEAGIPRLQILKTAFDAAPEPVLSSIIDGNIAVPILSRIELCLGLAPPLRNYGAHVIGSQPLMAARFDDILQLPLNAIFASIDLLY